MKIYHYHPETFEYLGEGIADQDPLQEGSWLIPAYATNVSVIEEVSGKTRHFENESWIYKEIPEPEKEVVPEPTYAEKRLAEYPPMADYLDGIVKGDQSQIQAYIDACLAVKAKYPKPIEG